MARASGGGGLPPERGSNEAGQCICEFVECQAWSAALSLLVRRKPPEGRACERDDDGERNRLGRIGIWYRLATLSRVGRDLWQSQGELRGELFLKLAPQANRSRPTREHHLKQFAILFGEQAVCAHRCAQ